jgi:hypothetical protein
VLAAAATAGLVGSCVDVSEVVPAGPAVFVDAELDVFGAGLDLAWDLADDLVLVLVVVLALVDVCADAGAAEAEACGAAAGTAVVAGRDDVGC